jgi:hypothetical protein
VTGVDEALEGVRSAIGLVHRAPGDTVVTPTRRAVEGVDRQHLHERDPQLDEMVEPLESGVERPLFREGADVQLIDHTASERPPSPVPVGPVVRVVRVPPRRPVHTGGLPARTRIGKRRLVVVE